MAMIIDLTTKKLEHWFADAHFNFNNQTWEFPNGEKIALRDVKNIVESLISKDAKGRYQIVRDGDGFLLFPMNGEGEVLRYPKEPEKKNYNLKDSDISWEKWPKIDAQPWPPQPAGTPWQVWTDSGTAGGVNDTQTWKIENSGLHIRASGGINDAAT